VGDSRTDLQTARAAGIRALGVTWGAHPRPELEHLGFDVLVDSPAALVNALMDI
jgi:phosphoglycolate phosphatase